jgi:hypothetical protein
LRFQFVGHQPIGGIHLQVPPAGKIGFIAGALDRPAMQPVGLVESGLDLLPDGERHL